MASPVSLDGDPYRVTTVRTSTHTTPWTAAVTFGGSEEPKGFNPYGATEMEQKHGKQQYGDVSDVLKKCDKWIYTWSNVFNTHFQ